MIKRETRGKEKEIVRGMTNAQKAKLVTGKDFWPLNGVVEFGLPELLVTDGPYGLRKQSGKADHIGLNESDPATCSPAVPPADAPD